MKQLIVLISTIVLGLAISIMVIGLKTPAKTVTDSVSGQITSIVSEYTTSSAIKGN